MTLDASIVIVSFNTRDVLRRCLCTLRQGLEGIQAEILVVDNASADGSADMVEAEFPTVHLSRSAVNLGFAGANNVALRHISGRYAVLLNSDAFLHPGALHRAIQHMDADPGVGLGGARLTGTDGSWQPSARLFPSLLNDFLSLSGLAARFPYSRFFGRADRTWANIHASADVDWVPGAFSIIRRKVLDEAGLFDESFFQYYEEVDLCLRIKRAGYRVRYLADVVVTHLGAESSRTVPSLHLARSGTQLTVWRMRSEFLFYRKHHGWLARAAKELERVWYLLRASKNGLKQSLAAADKVKESVLVVRLLEQAWRETSGGLISPERPW